jgi:hypothetical protein
LKKLFVKICDFFYYRFFDVYHKIDTGLKPNYHEIETRMLYGCFSLLVQYVEKAFSGIKSIEDRIEYLKNSAIKEIEENPDHGKQIAEHFEDEIIVLYEVMRLYLWWKEIFPNYEKNDPWMKDENDHLVKSYVENFKLGKNNSEGLESFFSECEKFDENKKQEITNNLLSLVKIRESMWI